MRRISFLLFGFVAMTFRLTFAAPLDAQRVAEGFRALDERYDSPTLRIWLDRPGDDLRGHFEGRINPPWWSAANAAEAMIDFMNATGRSDFDARLTEMHRVWADPMSRWPLVAAELKKRGQWRDGDDARLARKRLKAPDHTGFRNEYLDDSGWWGIAWLKMAERTGRAEFLATAKGIHAHMAAAWRPDLGGGVLWCLEEGKQNPNSITNQLFLILSARLAVQTGDPAYLDWARKAEAWIREKRLFDGTGVVDGPGHTGDYWSYNQGTYLAGMVAFAQAAKNPALLDDAASAADAILARAGFVSPDGVLIEKLGTSGWDGCLFKGVLARSLRETRDALAPLPKHTKTVALIDRVLQTTAAAILKSPPAPEGQFPAEWHAGAKNLERNFNTDTSALISLTAALPAQR